MTLTRDYSIAFMSHRLKVAVLFSGLPRGFRGTIKRNPWLRRADVFMHGWHETGSNSNEIHPSREKEVFKFTDRAQLQILYRPKSILFERPESWSIEGEGIIPNSIPKHYQWAINKDPETFLNQMLSNNISMWVSISRSWKLFEDFQQHASKEYDVVIRARYDIFPRIDLGWIEKTFYQDAVVIPDTNHPENMLNDWFAMGSLENMKAYCSLGNNFEEIFRSVQNNRSSWCNEYGLFEHLKDLKISVKELAMKFE